MEKNKVSVIIPIYKVEKFIERCVRSLMEQTLQEVEYIFVDDATPDKSIEVLERCLALYPNRKTVILHHSQNKGLPAARNTGLHVATGKYIFHCDSDDYVEHDMLEKLYQRAEETNADIVWCDWFLTFAENERYMRQPDYATPIDALKGILNGSMKYNVWNKLVKRSLYEENDIRFPAGYGMGEDMTMIRLFACAQRVAYLPQAFYHYVKLNTDAFTQTYSEKHFRDVQYNVNQTLAYLKEQDLLELEQEMAWFMLNVKLPFIISDRKEDYERWQVWYPEANPFIWKNKQQAFRTRLVQWMAWKGQFWFVWLYYKLIYRLVYGVIYR